MDWYISESPEIPVSPDTTSSRTHNFLRRKVKQKEREIDGETETYYEYEECKISKESYSAFLQIVQNADSISDVENAVCEESTATSERLDDIENAICELSEAIM